jgi:hypothetical protein
MSSHTVLILFIAGLIITVGGIVVIQEVTQTIRQTPGAIQGQDNTLTGDDELQITNIVGTNVENETYRYIRVQVAYEGDEKLSLNDTFIQVSTGSSVADLKYRNGTPERDTDEGFYTE